MTSCSVTSFKKAISEIPRRFCVDSNSEKSDPLFRSGRPSKASGRSSVSNIHPGDMAIPSELPLVSRNFILFKLASVWTFQQHIQTLFRVREESSIQVHLFGGHGNTVRMPVSVRQVKWFPSQTQIWEDSCNCPDVKSTPSGRYPW
jgi:hypothetical protein